MRAVKTPAKESSADSPKKKIARRVSAQPAPGEHVAFKSNAAISTPEESDANSAASSAIAEASPYGVIVEDGLPLGEGQMHRTDFMDQLASSIESTADELLKQAGRTARDCPYLDFWLSHYREQSASRIERAIAGYASPRQTDLEGIRQAVLTRVREAVQAWVEHREVRLPDDVGGVPDAAGDGAAAQRMGSNGLGSAAAPGSAAAIRNRLSSGTPLDSTVRTRMERGFGTGFDNVRIHTDRSAAQTVQEYDARAFTVGKDVAFGSGEYRPGTPTGDALIAHELAHVVQQRGAAKQGALPKAESANGPLEQDADSSTASVMSKLWGNATTGLDRRGPGLRSGLKLQRCGKGSGKEDAGTQKDAAIEDPKKLGYNTILDGAGLAKKDTVLQLKSLEQADGDVSIAKFQSLSSNDALKILALEPFAAGTPCAAWFPKLNNVALTLTDPYAGGTGGPSVVKAYYFKGSTERRALVIGGVHNQTEPQGTAVVEKLRAILAARPTPPFFTTILVPSLFDPSRYATGKNPLNRWIKGGTGTDSKGNASADRPVEPNRNFPLPGEGLEDAHNRGVQGGSELVFPPGGGKPNRAPHDETATGKGGHDGTSTKMLPENRALVALIEAFQPERLASVHAHSLKDKDKDDNPQTPPVGDAPGIFVDPRGGFDRTTDKANTATGADDDRLARAMVVEGGKQLKKTPIKGAPSDPFSGNRPTSKGPTSVHYADSATHTEGNSLGDWAPVPVTSGSGARNAITTVTVEVPQWGHSSAQIPEIEQLDAKLLNEIFLEDPSKVT